GEVKPRGEREIIEAALAESRGRVSGPTGAAAKLGIPPSTLDHRIKALKIHKKQIKFRSACSAPPYSPESPDSPKFANSGSALDRVVPLFSEYYQWHKACF